MNETKEQEKPTAAAGPNERLVKRRGRQAMVAAVKSMKSYWETYDQQNGYENYSVETFIDDALYAIGIAIDDKQFKYADGYQKFKNLLLEHLGV